MYKTKFEKRKKILEILLTEQEFQELTRVAVNSHLSVSGYARQKIFKKGGGM